MPLQMPLIEAAERVYMVQREKQAWYISLLLHCIYSLILRQIGIETESFFRLQLLWCYYLKYMWLSEEIFLLLFIFSFSRLSSVFFWCILQVVSLSLRLPETTFTVILQFLAFSSIHFFLRLLHQTLDIEFHSAFAARTFIWVQCTAFIFHLSPASAL